MDVQNPALCRFILVADRWKCQNPGCSASYDSQEFSSPLIRECGKRIPRQALQSVQLDATDPPYWIDLEKKILDGKAMRPAAEIAAMLEVCRENRCGNWPPMGCRKFCGCDGSTADLFAALLASKDRRCDYWTKTVLV